MISLDQHPKLCRCATRMISSCKWGINYCQGVDILAGIGTDHNDIQVFLPDVLEGQYAQGAWFTPDATPQQAKAKEDFFSHVGAPARIVTITPKIVSDLSQKYPSIKSWGALGLCWGAKVMRPCHEAYAHCR